MRIQIVAVAALASLLGGCAYSVHPLYKGGDTVEDNKIVGTWLYDAGTSGKGEVTIIKSGAQYEARLPLESGRENKYDVNLVKIGDQVFADVFFKGVQVGSELKESPPGTAPLHEFIKFSVNGDTLEWAIIDQDWLAKQFENKKLFIAHEDYDDSRTVLTAAPAELQGFLKLLNNSPDAFEKETAAKRKKEAAGLNK